MHANSYIQSATAILSSYNGEIPFASWLKNYFRQHKKFGSRDRKVITQLCYSFFRLGNAFSQLAAEEKLFIGLFLTSQEKNNLLQELRPEWNDQVHLSTVEKLKWLDVSNEHPNIFPFSEALSHEIDKQAFQLSHLTQPLLYLRIRPGKKKKVVAQLNEAGIDFEKRTDDCLALANSTKATEVLMLNRDAVVQDLNSQKVMDILPEELLGKNIQAWDCCAASGGKSILLYDKNLQVQLTVSDVRESILINLKKRFAEAGINNYRNFVADISKPTGKLPITNFDLIICDAPCSGSGTWGRTPEQLVYFTKNKIEHYTQLQKAIATNAAQHLKKEGWFLYITCSVYKAENEEVVQHLQTNTSLQLHTMQYFRGYNQKADTLFAAAFHL